MKRDITKNSSITEPSVVGKDIEEGTEPVRIENRRVRGKWIDSHVVFFVLPVVLTILFPGGGAFYLCGRFGPYALPFLGIHVLYLGACAFIFFCFLLGIIRLSRRRVERAIKERFLIAAETGVALIFVGLLVANFFFRDPDFLGHRQKCFMLGLRDRVRNRADVEATRVWLQSPGVEDYDDGYRRISRTDLPESLRGLRDAGAMLSADENGNAKVRLIWGSGMAGHWGVEVGMKDMDIPPSDFSRYGEVRLPLEPGVYVWWALE